MQIGWSLALLIKAALSYEIHVFRVIVVHIIINDKFFCGAKVINSCETASLLPLFFNGKRLFFNLIVTMAMRRLLPDYYLITHDESAKGRFLNLYMNVTCLLVALPLVCAV